MNKSQNNLIRDEENKNEDSYDIQLSSKKSDGHTPIAANRVHQNFVELGN